MRRIGRVKARGERLQSWRRERALKAVCWHFRHRKIRSEGSLEEKWEAELFESLFLLGKELITKAIETATGLIVGEESIDLIEEFFVAFFETDRPRFFGEGS